MTRAVVKSVCEPEPPGRIKWIERKKKKKKNCPLNCVKAKSSKRSLQTTHYLKGYLLWLSKLHLSVSFLPFYESLSLLFVVVHFCSSDTTTTKNIRNCGIFFKGWFRGRNPRWIKIKQEVRNTFFFFFFPTADTSLCFLVVLAVLLLAAGVCIQTAVPQDFYSLLSSSLPLSPRLHAVSLSLCSPREVVWLRSSIIISPKRSVWLFFAPNIIPKSQFAVVNVCFVFFFFSCAPR